MAPKIREQKNKSKNKGKGKRKNKIKPSDKNAKQPNNQKIANEKWFIRELKKVPLFKAIYSVNDSKYFAGFIMIVLNIGSKYVVVNLSKTQEDYLKNTLGRQILIFSIAWMGTRDILPHLLLPHCFI